MRKTVLSALALPLLLAACNSSSNSSSNPKPTAPDPLTLNFTATGTLQNYTPASTQALSVSVPGGTAAVGQLTTDKGVSVTLTPTIAQQGARKLSDQVSGLKGKSCDVSKLSVQDATYRGFSSFDFTTAKGVASHVEARTITNNSDGTRTIGRKAFWYATSAGSITGTYTCPNSSQTTFNLNLKPGWNLIDTTWNYNPTTDVTTNLQYSNAVSTTTYSGSWYAYSND